VSTPGQDPVDPTDTMRLASTVRAAMSVGSLLLKADPSIREQLADIEFDRSSNAGVFCYFSVTNWMSLLTLVNAGWTVTLKPPTTNNGGAQ
jgi:hypothetical protein